MGVNSSKQDFIFIKTSTMLKRVCLDDIRLVHCEDTVSDISFKSGDHLACSKPLSYFEEQLPHNTYMRVNRQDIVNLTMVSEISNTSSRNKFLTLDDDTKVLVSYRRWPDVRVALLALM